MHQLKEFKQQRKALKIRLKAAKREVKTLEQELKELRLQEQHKAADNLEYWIDKGEENKRTFFRRVADRLTGH